MIKLSTPILFISNLISIFLESISKKEINKSGICISFLNLSRIRFHIGMIRCVSKKIFHAIGWRLEGRYPNELPKKIIIVAPHTSSIDFPIGILVKFWLNMKVTFYAKEELFKGISGWFLKALGGRSVDRCKKNNLVRQAIEDFKKNENYTILLTPEGTRKRVDKFKSGFYYIALKAKVPLVPIAFDYEHKRIKIFPTYRIKGEGEKEIEKIRQLFKGIKGKVPEYSII